MVTRNPVQICLGSWEQGIQYKFVLDEGLKKSSTSLPWIKGTRNLQRTLCLLWKREKRPVASPLGIEVEQGGPIKPKRYEADAMNWANMVPLVNQLRA